jgi:hypothetical protein
LCAFEIQAVLISKHCINEADKVGGVFYKKENAIKSKKSGKLFSE